MSSNNESIGVIGLGVMGSNIVLNLVDHGYKVHVFNRTLSKVHDITKHSENILGHETIEDFIVQMKGTRIILLEVKAGKTVDDFLDTLNTLLDDNDIVIDCGNSDFNDTIRREKNCKFNFVGMGVSGGEYGARHGPSLMVGCKREVYDVISPILISISAKYKDIPCCGYMGENGAGHFVKIVHNGIEYVEMQLLQEIFNIFGNENKVLEIFKNFNNGRLQSYLLEICCKILSKRDNDGLIINKILDKAEQKGTGKMCINTALEIGVESSSIVESVFSRFLSNKKDIRVEFSKLVNGNKKNIHKINLDINEIENAMYLCKAISYIQGFNLLFTQKKLKSWNYSINDICNVWRNGCILRGRFLETLKNLKSEELLECSEMFIEIYKECYESLKKLCIFIAENEIYAPVFTSCYNWLNGLKMDKMNGSLIQAMRDYFGRHGVVIDGEYKNIDWE